MMTHATTMFTGHHKKATHITIHSFTFFNSVTNNVFSLKTFFKKFNMTSYICIECKKTVGQRQQGLQCDGCNRWQHRSCNTGVSQQRYRDAVRTWGEIDWRCSNCSILNPVLKSVSVAKRKRNHPREAQNLGRFEVSLPFEKESMENAVPNNIPAVVYSQINEYEVIESSSQRGDPPTKVMYIIISK
jgi:hypothetical protein